MPGGVGQSARLVLLRGVPGGEVRQPPVVPRPHPSEGPRCVRLGPSFLAWPAFIFPRPSKGDVDGKGIIVNEAGGGGDDR